MADKYECLCFSLQGTSEVPDIPAALSPVKNQTQPRQAVAPVPTPVHAAASSEAPVGRKGRLANLAATIGSWEDDLSHAAPRRRDYAQGNPGSVSIATPAWRREACAKPISVVADRTQMSQSSNSITVPDSNQVSHNATVGLVINHDVHNFCVSNMSTHGRG